MYVLALRGAYGVVWKAMDKKTLTVVALKKCFDAFQNRTDAQRTYREIMYLDALGGHDNIITVHNVLKSMNDKDIYVVTDFMESDLHAVIKAGILLDIHKQFITYQILRALKYIHSGQVIHRDIKPSNILLNSDCSVKICDFGLARSVSHSNAAQFPIMTDYVATRWYRAPEILLGATEYSFGVDLWAVGCLLGEMLLGRPLFPGTSTINQLDRILEVTGYPDEEDLKVIGSQFAEPMLECLPRKPRRSLKQMMPQAPPEAIELLSGLLQLNPSKRISVVDALESQYVKCFKGKEDEPVLNAAITLSLDDDVKLNITDYMNRLYEEVAKKRRSRAPKAAT